MKSGGHKKSPARGLPGRAEEREERQSGESILPLEAEGALEETRIADDVADLAKALRVRETEARVAPVYVVEQVVGFGADEDFFALGEGKGLDERGVHIEE